MTSPLMFKVLDGAQELNNVLLPLIITWDIKTHRLIYRKEGAKLSLPQKLWFIEAFTLFGVLGVGTFLVDILFLLRSPPDHPLYLEITKSANLISTRLTTSTVFFGGCFFMFGIYRWGADIGACGNELLDFEQKLTREIQSKQRKKRWDMKALFMMAILFVGIFAPPIPALVTVYRGQDSYYTVLRLILPQTLFRYRWFRWTSALFRFLILASTAYEIGRILVTMLFAVFMLSMVYLRSTSMIQKSYERLPNERRLQASSYVKWYNQFFLIMRVGNIVGSGPVWAGIIITKVLFITFAIILIKLRDRQPLPMLLISGVFTFGIVFLMAIILPLMLSLYEDCVCMLHKWRNDPRVVGDRRYLTAKLRGLEPYCLFIGFELHKLEVIDRQFVVGFVYGMISQTVDVLLAMG